MKAPGLVVAALILLFVILLMVSGGQPDTAGPERYDVTPPALVQW